MPQKFFPYFYIISKKTTKNFTFSSLKFVRFLRTTINSSVVAYIKKQYLFHLYKNLMKYIIFSFFLFFLQCQTITKKKHKPIFTEKGFVIYKYTEQKNIDTLGYHFNLKNKEQNLNNGDSKKWTTLQLKEFEQKMDTLSSLYNLNSQEYISFSSNLLNYSKQGDIKERLPLILKLFSKIKISSSEFISQLDFEYVLDHIILNESEEVKKIVNNALVKRLYNGTPNDFDYIAPLFLDNTSKKYYNALIQMYRNIEDNNYLKTVYYYNVLPEIARIAGRKGIEHIFKCFRHELSNGGNIERIIYHMESILARLEHFHDIDNDLIKIITEQTKKSKILFALYDFKKNPVKVSSDKEQIINIIKKAQANNLLPLNIPKRLQYRIISNYCNNYYNIDTEEFLEIIKATFKYNSSSFTGSSHFVDKSRGYRTIMEKFMITSQSDLPNFYAGQNLRHTENFSLFLGSQKEGYVIKVNGEEFLNKNHIAISELFNHVLKENKIGKQFSVKNLSKQKEHEMFVSYQNLNQIDNFLKSIE